MSGTITPCSSRLSRVKVSPASTSPECSTAYNGSAGAQPVAYMRVRFPKSFRREVSPSIPAPAAGWEFLAPARAAR
jgi:hypothetical protein